MTTPPPPPPGQSGPPPGWYPDPYGQPVERWWDERQWTGSIQPFANQQASSGGSGGASTAIWIVSGIALAFVLFIGFAGSTGEGASDEPDEFSAWRMCQERMDEQLSAPPTADYPSVRDVDVTEQSDGWLIRCYVDAENPMSGTVREDFTCELEHVSGSNYRISLRQ